MTEAPVTRERSAMWETLFKFNQLVFPFIVLWAIWVTVNIFELRSFKGEGGRYTDVQAAADNRTTVLQMKDWVRTNFPPKKLEDRIERIATQVELNHDALIEIQSTLKHLE